jgi:DNA-binding response OmpR family regulator
MDMPNRGVVRSGMSFSAPPALLPFTPTLAGRTVLVIEDHEDSREMLAAVLRSLQAHVLAASNIEEAEHELHMTRPHLIICDLKLPDGSGLDFIKWLRAHRRWALTPCIAITGWKDQIPDAVIKQFDSFMIKPVDLDKFCNAAIALTQR